MNGTNLIRGAIALTIPSLLLACTRNPAEQAAEERREADRAQAEANQERREADRAQVEASTERREKLDEGRADPKIQPNQPEAKTDRARSDEPSTNAVNAVKGLEAKSVQQITAARCEREQKCGNVGPGEDYTSASVCQQKVGAEWANELNAYDCPGGIVTKELQECLEEIKNEDCGSPFETLGRIVACRSSDLCKSVE